MNSKATKQRPFLLSVLLILYSFMAILMLVLLIYTAIFYAEAERGLETYLLETFVKFPFGLIYSLLVLFSTVFSLAILLMWFRKKMGLLLYFSWTFAMILLLLFAEQIDWFNIIVLIVLSLALILNFKYFTSKEEQESDSEIVAN